MILVPVGFYLLSTRSVARIGRYVWLWGWLAAALVGGLWPAWVYSRFPDVLEMWRYDYGGRLNGGYVAEPWWYYGLVLLWALLPWTPALLVGLFISAKRLKTSAPVRFLWCWAVGILVFFSIPDGKHHHYFLHCVPAWAMLTALGLRRCWEAVAAWRPRWRGGLPIDPWRVGGVTFASLGLVFIAMHFVFAYAADESREDAAFLKSVPALIAPQAPLFVNAELRSCLEVNRILFDLGPRVQAVHNLTFLLAEERREPRIYLLTQARDLRFLNALGEVRQVAESPHSRREESPRAKLTLFELTFAPDLPRYSSHVYIEQQQIKHRKPGPFLGGVPPNAWGTSLSKSKPDPAVRTAGFP
jgi:hypothetical protein